MVLLSRKSIRCFMAASSGKPLTIEKLFIHYGPELTRFLNKKLKDKQRAEDITQDVFIRMQRIKNIGQLENPKAYLYRTAANLLIDEQRREKLHKVYCVEEQSAQAFENKNFSDCVTPEKILSAQQLILNFKQALDGMPANCRQAFLLHRVNGLTYSSIAKEMAVSVSSVEKYLINALKYCRRALDDDKS